MNIKNFIKELKKYPQTAQVTFGNSAFFRSAVSNDKVFHLKRFHLFGGELERKEVKGEGKSKYFLTIWCDE